MVIAYRIYQLICYPNNTETITLFYENEIFYKNDYNQQCYQNGLHCRCFLVKCLQSKGFWPVRLKKNMSLATFQQKTNNNNPGIGGLIKQREQHPVKNHKITTSYLCKKRTVNETNLNRWVQIQGYWLRLSAGTGAIVTAISEKSHKPLKKDLAKMCFQ